MTTPSAFVNGLRRGRREVVQVLRSPKELFNFLSTPVLMVVLGLFVRVDIPGSDVGMGHLIVAGGITTMIAQASILVVPQALAVEKEDGTLLRMRTVSGGMTAYLVGKTCVVVVTAVGGALLTLAGGVLFVGTDLPRDLAHWGTFAWVILLSLVTLTPLGAALGALLPNPRGSLALMMLIMLFLLGFSGLYFPVTVLPGFVQAIVSIFPLKWIGQGIRSSLLPDAALAAETAQSWQLMLVFVVLAVWAAVGFAIAPGMLRRMSRRESGTRLKKAVAS